MLGTEKENVENVLKEVPDLPPELRSFQWRRGGEFEQQKATNINNRTYEYIVAITIKTEILLCSGALITEDLVLTAADCIPTVRKI